MKHILLIVFGICFPTQIVLGEEDKVCPLNDDFHRSYIGILLSPISGQKNPRQIRILWGNERFKRGDVILLFSHDSVKGFETIYNIRPSEAFGMNDTGLYIDPGKLFPHLLRQNFTAECIKYYVAWIREGFIRDINCLGTQPTWMTDQRHLFENKTLQELFIPGTHDSGSYASWGYNGLGYILEPYSKTQDLSILEQLLFGVRYLDIKLGYYSDNKVSIWWVNYDTIRKVPLHKVIEQVKTFLSKTDEFVIFNVREFPVGFGDDSAEYVKLFRYLWSKFKNYLIPSAYDWDSPLSVMRTRTSRRLYLTFNLTRQLFQGFTIRKSITHYWGDADDEKVLYEHLNDAERVPIEKHDCTPKVSIAELARRNDKSSNNLRSTADSINHNITLWYHKYWFDLANIVAVDFLQSSGIVDVAIRANKFRFTKREVTEPNPVCIRPYLRTTPNVGSMMNQPNVMELLFPRIVDDAPEKIYDLVALT